MPWRSITVAAPPVSRPVLVRVVETDEPVIAFVRPDGIGVGHWCRTRPRSSAPRRPNGASRLAGTHCEAGEPTRARSLQISAQGPRYALPAPAPSRCRPFASALARALGAHGRLRRGRGERLRVRRRARAEGASVPAAVPRLLLSDRSSKPANLPPRQQVGAVPVLAVRDGGREAHRGCGLHEQPVSKRLRHWVRHLRRERLRLQLQRRSRVRAGHRCFPWT